MSDATERVRRAWFGQRGDNERIERTLTCHRCGKSVPSVTAPTRSDPPGWGWADDRDFCPRCLDVPMTLGEALRLVNGE